jgi:ABC-type glycerol-3-phosphate transport system permease component
MNPKRRIIGKTLMSILGFGIALTIAFPLIWLILTSLKPKGEIIVYPPSFLPINPTISNYTTLLEVTNILTYFKNSFIVAFSASLVAIVISLFGVYSLSRFKFRGQSIISILLVIAYMLPQIFLIIPFLIFWSTLGFSDSLFSLAVTMISFTLPFSVWMLRSYIESIPVALEEAALIDGATRLQAFYKVIVPGAVPGIVSTFIFCFILVWNDYLFALVLISSDANKTITLGISLLIGEKAMWSWGVLSAGAVFATVPILILFMFVQTRLLGGFSAGALKG